MAILVCLEKKPMISSMAKERAVAFFNVNAMSNNMRSKDLTELHGESNGD